MELKNLIVPFIVGGVVTALITSLELSNHRIWSGVAALMPVFTLISYFFIGLSKDGSAISEHAKFVLIGTLLAWAPYMLAIIFLAPKLGASKSVGIGLLLFCLIALLFVALVEKFHLFQSA